jgi:glycosyltransferase involved in cell wall biosynthesis
MLGNTAVPIPPEQALQLTVLMPCLNEAETVARCVEKARKSLDDAGVHGEVVVADNGSSDDSIELAERFGARVVRVAQKGYGNALRGGIQAARGEWVIMADADDSYDFSSLQAFIEKLRAGYELVMGCRMPGGGGRIEPGAMPWHHRWIGNPVLSFIGRLLFHCPVTDFHCGLRAFRKDAYERLMLKTTGMEFASEMVIKATLFGQNITQVPITLHKDGRSRPPHLRSFRDGWRHLRFMLLYSPRWLFLYPGLCLMSAGALVMAWLLPGPRVVGGATLGVHTLLYAAISLLVGFQAVAFAVLSREFALGAGLLPDSARFRWVRHFKLETGVLIGLALAVAGIMLSLYAIGVWSEVKFGALNVERTFRLVIPGALIIVLGSQLVLSSLFLSVLGLRHQGSVLP